MEVVEFWNNLIFKYLLPADHLRWQFHVTGRCWQWKIYLLEWLSQRLEPICRPYVSQWSVVTVMTIKFVLKREWVENRCEELQLRKTIAKCAESQSAIHKWYSPVARWLAPVWAVCAAGSGSGLRHVQSTWIITVIFFNSYFYLLFF